VYGLGHVVKPEPSYVGVERSVPQGTWQHQSPFLTGGAHGASGHVATPEPFPDGWRALCHGARGDIRILPESGLTPMMVLHDYMSKRITPLQERTRLAWLYTGVNDVTWLERGDESTLSEEVLALVMGKLSPDLSSHDFVTPPTFC
jgi:hypothetical protein